MTLKIARHFNTKLNYKFSLIKNLLIAKLIYQKNRYAFLPNLLNFD